MLLLAVFAVLAATGAGLVAKFFLDRFSETLKITWLEFIVGALIIAFFITPLTTCVGWNVAKSNKLNFKEYWNGYELRAIWDRTECTRDGPCVYEYDCDPYIHVHTRTVTDSDGDSHTETYTETHYHSCPYTDEEWTFGIDTTLGFYKIANHWLPTDPESHRWRGGKSVPDRFSSGIPQFWAAAKNRIDAGEPGPVTKRMTYDNYILASDNSILKQYSDTIERYREANLLPDVAHEIRDFYYADKVHFVGYAPQDPVSWQNAVMYLNAALGEELQGDLHLVIVQNRKIIGEPDAYITALKAHWGDPKTFGDNAISKNAIIVVVGTEDGKTVSWARALTGMPLGNEAMLVAVRNNFKGIPLMPDAVVGNVQGEFYTEVDEDSGEKELEVRGTHSGGALEKILWGIDNPQTKFKRVSMTANDGDDIGGGFLYLDSEIEPSVGQKVAIVVLVFVFSLVVWLAFAAIDAKLPGRERRDDY